MAATVDRLDTTNQREAIYDGLAATATSATQAPYAPIVGISEGQREPILKHGVLHHAKKAVKGATRHSPEVVRYSLPSEEKEGLMPGESTDGVGALPGMLDDTSVVRLPLEREDPDPYSHPTEAMHYSLPSQEKEGLMPGEHTDGVGALPGMLDDTSVVRLPLEREDPDPYSHPTQHATEAQPTEGQEAPPLGEHPIVTTTNVVPHAPFERPQAPMKHDSRHLAKKAAKGAARAAGLSTEPVHYSLPSEETEGLRPGESTGGVGPLPGMLDDTSVARLPLEREDPDPYSHPHAPLERSEDHTKHSQRHAKKVAKGTTGLSSEPVHYSLPSEEKEGLKPGESTGGVGPLPGMLDDTSVAKLPLEREDPDPFSHQPTTRPTQTQPTESHGKVPLMEKIRGEMKVITGHLTGHRAKTEEGKALKKGASTAH